MTLTYQQFFGFTREPFGRDIPIRDLYALPGLTEVTERFDFTLRCGAVGLVTGDVGAGKSTSLRYACSQLHPSKYQVILVTALNGTYIELLRQIVVALGLPVTSNSPAMLTKHIQSTLLDIVSKKKMPVLVIDEAHHLRLEVLGQLHALIQFDFDSKSVLPMILCGQNNLIDLLSYHTSRPLSSRIIGRSHLLAITREQMSEYLHHHLAIVGIKHSLFSEEAELAIYQGSGGFLRRANFFALGSLARAASEGQQLVTPDHVRIAASEVFA